MKRLLYGSLLLLGSCGDNMIRNMAPEHHQEPVEQGQPQAVVATPKATANLLIGSEEDLIGYWVGWFEPDTEVEAIYTGEVTAWDYRNKINLSIDRIKGSEVSGHSVVAGNDRPFSGQLKREGNTFRLELKEPGDDQYDGIFHCSIEKGDSTVAGTWKANRKIRIPVRRYQLTKKLFRYNPGWQMEMGQYVDWTKKKRIKISDDIEDGYLYDDTYFTTTEEATRYNASTDRLQKEQVANMKKGDLFILRNAIYARHGYSFRNRQLRAYFDQQAWYIPVSTNIKSDFTEIEKANIELLLRYEKNAKEYYDVFGRG